MGLSRASVRHPIQRPRLDNMEQAIKSVKTRLILATQLHTAEITLRAVCAVR